MKSKCRRVKSPITSKDVLGIPYSLEDVASKMKNAAFFSEVLGPVTNDLVEELVDKGKLKATRNCEGNYEVSQNDYADFYDEIKKEHDSLEQLNDIDS